MKNTIKLSVVLVAFLLFSAANKQKEVHSKKFILTTKVINFKTKSINGKQYWFWSDDAGKICSNKRKWKYKVRSGDSYVQRNKCSSGARIYEITYSGMPTRIK
ncbi:hypothetical protein [Winogradskyella sp.]|uniref:hypothetical protein n=1 Tax=Winogradskyella sp. TaxID=1883156 RepID=UPI003BAB8C98